MHPALRGASGTRSQALAMTWFRKVTSRLPSTPAHRGSHSRPSSSRHGAEDGNRTRVTSLEDWRSAVELHPRTVPGIEPGARFPRAGHQSNRVPPGAQPGGPNDVVRRRRGQAWNRTRDLSLFRRPLVPTELHDREQCSGKRSRSWIPSIGYSSPSGEVSPHSRSPVRPYTMHLTRFSTPRPSRPLAFGSRRNGRIRTGDLTLPKRAR